VLEGLVIKGVAGHAINGDGLRNVRVENCDIADCGAGGVYVGGTKVVTRFDAPIAAVGSQHFPGTEGGAGTRTEQILGLDLRGGVFLTVEAAG